MEDWQHGYDLNILKQYASLFKNAHKHLVFGAFGLVKERDIANGLFNGCCEYVHTDYLPKAVALCSGLKHTSRHVLFDGAEVNISAGDVFIRDIAAVDKTECIRLFEHIKSRYSVVRTGFFESYRGLWVEIFEEDLVARQAVIEYGLNYVGTKIAAGSEIKGLYFNGVVDLVRHPLVEELTLAELSPRFITVGEQEEIQKELVQAEQFWQQHYSSYNKRKSWTSFCLRGYKADDPGFIIKPFEMSRSWKQKNSEMLNACPADTVISHMFPVTNKIINTLPGIKDRVRFMKLRRKDGELTRHADITDRDAGVADGKVCRLHIPIITSPNVEFHAWDARGNEIIKSFDAGSLFYLDQRKPHAVTNSDPSIDRVHLVVDCFSNSDLRSMLEASKIDHAYPVVTHRS